MKGVIYNIQRYSIHDGRGIRTTVFFKGCQLSCPWCANPESQSPKMQLGFSAARCTGCQKCAAICENGAVHIVGGLPETDRSACTACGRCARACLSEARTVYGYETEAEDLAAVLYRDMPFFRRSGGGVTASGGEATLQADFLFELFSLLKDMGVDTALESHGCFDKSVRELILPVTDRFLLDFKHSDTDAHLRACGMGNELVKDNFTALAGSGKEVIMRIPVIPGFNDTDENMEESARFAAKLGVPVCLLPFHAMASGKYTALGRTYTYAKTQPPSGGDMDHFLDIFLKMGVTAQTGG